MTESEPEGHRVWDTGSCFWIAMRGVGAGSMEVRVGNRVSGLFDVWARV